MNLSKLSALVMSVLFLFGCNSDGIPDNARVGDKPIDTVGEDYGDAEGVLAQENFDLLAVGNLLDEAGDAAEFERLINKDNGVNNLDLNGDGFADYISVEEFEDRTDDQRGFTLLSRFGPDDVQEVASIIFGRDRPGRRGARIYIRGNEQMYGDSYYYDGNWLDKSLAIASWVFGDRNMYYRSPYYYNNYPDYYDVYRVIKTPLYRKRVFKYQVNPAMTKITTPFMKIKIKSRYPGRSYRRAHAKMAKPTKEQLIFFKNKRGKNGIEKNGKDKITLRGPEEAPKDRSDRGKQVKRKAETSGKPVIDTKANKGDRKGAGKLPLKKNDAKRNNPKKGPDQKGDRSNGKGGKPGKNQR